MSEGTISVGRLKRLKRFWFSRMEAVAASYAPAHRGSCFCPLCLRGFGIEAIESGELTLEHAPPKAMGGREITLTCRDCNGAGSRLDVDMKKFDEILRFQMRTLDTAIPVSLVLEAGELRANLSSTQENVRVELAVKANRPGQESIIDDWAADANRGERKPISIRFQPYHEEGAFVGLLRVAYLGAFARFGYRYITRPSLAQVREQIRLPFEKVLPAYSAHNLEAKGNERLLVVVRNEDLPDCIIAQLGVHLIFLPGPDDAGGFYEALDARSKAGRFRVENGAAFLWPRKPELLLDFEH